MNGSQGRDSGTWASDQLNADKPESQTKKLRRTAFWRTWPLLWVIATWAAIAFVLFITAGLTIWWLFVNDPTTPEADLFVGENGADPLKFVQTILAIVGGVGAVGYLVIKYRERSDAESSKADQRLLEAVTQLGSDSPQVRIAGVYALADIADTFQSRYRQRVVDILCGYLRTYRAGDWAYEEASSDEGPFHDAAVEASVVAVIASHLRRDFDDPTSWSLCSFDFHRAIFNELADFENVIFGSKVNFSRVIFRAPIRFSGAVFKDEVFFVETKSFSWASFQGVRFCGLTTFARSKWRGYVEFMRASFVGESSFVGAEFKGISDFSGVRYLNARGLTEVQEEWLQREDREEKQDGRVEEETAYEPRNRSGADNAAANDDVAPAAEETHVETGAADEESADKD